MSKNWTVARAWNESLGKRPERPVEPREAIWASELAKSDVDIYLKMIGETPTNFPNDRAMRKMDAGNIWEWAIKSVFIKCGLMKPTDTQISVVSDIGEDFVPVRGRLDFIAGGEFNYEEAVSALEQLLLPEEIKRGIRNIFDSLKDTPDLAKKVIELKSVASFGYDKVERTGKPLGGHALQLFHYAHGLKMEGALIYFCRDDARMIEIPIMPNDQRLLEEYKEKISRVTGYYRRKEMPPLEPPIVFDEAMGKFSKNFNVEYSMFLTRNYGIKDQTEFIDTYKAPVERINRVLGRIATGKPMTANNEQAIEEMKALGFDTDRVIEIVKAKAKSGEVVSEESEE